MFLTVSTQNCFKSEEKSNIKLAGISLKSVITLEVVIKGTMSEVTKCTGSLDLSDWCYRILLLCPGNGS